MTTPDALVDVERLTKRYGGLVAVDDLSLVVQRGEMVGLIGPDGAGKTTTLRCVLCLLTPEEGRVTTCGLDPVRRHRRLADRVGYLSQRFSLYGDLSVDENVEFFAAVHGVRGWRPRRDELLELLALAPFRARLADRLSGGMKQKLALACTLVHTPELLVLDEPTTGVDPVSRRDFWRILFDLKRRGLTLLVTTPYLDEAERCERIAFLNGGRLLASDTPEALRNAGTDAGQSLVEVLARPKAVARALLARHAAVAAVETFGERLHVSWRGPDALDGVAALLRASDVEVVALRSVRPSLEDVFIERVRAAGVPGAAA